MLLYLSDFIPILQIFKMLSIYCLNLEFLCNYGLGQLLSKIIVSVGYDLDRLNGCLDISGYGALNRVFNIIFFVYKNNTNEVLKG